jgi:hypothetical protein
LLVIVAPVTSSRLVALPAAVWAALAAYVSFGAIAFTGPGGARLGVLPLDAAHLLLAALAGLVVLAIGLKSGRGAAVAVAVSPLVLLFLPWLPFRVPAVFLIWTGALASLVWAAVAVALALACFVVYGFTPSPGRKRALLAGVVSACVFSVAAWYASPVLPGGDEPHYLVITQSLLYDGDLKIENNHDRGDYRAYYAADLPPHVVRPGRNGQMYSIHAPGLPAMILPAFAIGGYHGVVIFLILVASAACALAWWLAWRTTGSLGATWFGWAAVTLSAPFLLESYTVFPDGPGAAIVLTGFWALLRADWERAADHAAQVAAEYADHADQVAAEHADHADQAAAEHADHAGRSWVPWMLHGAALAALPWLHTRFAVLAAALGGLILVRLARTSNPFTKAAAFLTVPVLSALAWLGFFLVVYGTLDPTAPYGGEVGSSFAYLTNGFGGLLFDQGFGLLATAPVLAVAFIGFARAGRLAVEWLVVAIPYLLSVGTYPMWWAGYSGPARFLVPLLLPLAIPAACAWTSARSRGLKAVMLGALLVSAWLSAVMAGGGAGQLGYHTRNEGGLTAAPYLEWANHVVDLPSAFPAFVPQPVQPDPGGLVSRRLAARSGFMATLAWALCLGAAAFAVSRIGRRRSPVALVAGATLTFACAVMAAVSIVWKVQAADPVTVPAAQLDALRRAASGHVAVFDLMSRTRRRGADTWTMRIEAPVRRPGRGGPVPSNRPLAVFQRVPAGTYLLSAKRHGGGDGLLIVGVGNDQFAIVTQPIAVFDAGLPIHLPVGARTLTIRGDEGARAQLDAIDLRPIALAVAPATLDVPRRAVRYDGTVVFFLDDRAFPEPSGFWVGAARDTRVALAPDAPRGHVSVVLRNAPVENTVSLEFAGRREEIVLKPGEERRVDVPLGPAGASALLHIRTSSGFRPSAVDPNSRDTRLLGVYVRTLEP